MSQTDASRLREARKQCRIVLEDGDPDALMAADLRAMLDTFDGLIPAAERREVDA